MEPPNLDIDFFATHWGNIISFFTLLFCSAMASGSEAALFSISHTEIGKMEEQDEPISQMIVRILKEPQKLLATILITNNLVNISIVFVFTPMGEYLFAGLTPIVRAILDVGFVTFFILLFGEILPKIYASRNNIRFARMVIRPLWVLNILFIPLSLPMKKSTLFLNKKLKKDDNKSISVEELSQALELTDQRETTQDEHRILEGVVSFGATETREIMRPRMDICGIEEGMSFSQIMEIIVENGYSRVPVYSESIDHICGVLYAKDLLPYIGEENFDWKKLSRKAIFVPENKKLNDLLKEFQYKKVHLAVVVDEYGGTSGIITLEDIIEEIVGEISDEYDEEDSFYTKIDEGVFVFDGKTTIKDFYRVMNFKEHEEEQLEQARGEAETVAGLWLEVAQSLPSKGQRVRVGDCVLEVESVSKRRIKQLKVIKERK